MPRNQFRVSLSRRTVLGLGLLFVLASSALAVDRRSEGHHIAPCSNATLKGSYGYYKAGPILDGGGQMAEVGIFTYDGNGGTAGRGTRNTNGEVFSGVSTGFYAVNADCTGALINGDGGEYAFLVVVNGGDGIYIVSENNPLCVVATKIRAD